MATTPAKQRHLMASLVAVCPVSGLYIAGIDSSVGARIDFAPAATPAQQIAAQNVLATFNWSDGAQQSYQLQQDRAAAIDIFLADTSANAKVLRGTILAILDEINILRLATPRAISSITRVGAVATATCPLAHGMLVGDAFAVSGADVAAYNVAGTVATVPSATTFTYAVAGTPVTPATGSLSYTLGAVPAMQARTVAQAKTAIQNKVNGGTVD